MKIIKFSLFVVLSLAISCKTIKTQSEYSKKVSEEHKQEHAKAHWTYTGKTNPEHWSSISEKYKACAGVQQSPINIEDMVVVKKNHLNLLDVNFNKTKTNIINNGHTIQFNAEAGSMLKFNGKTYELKQFHMHSLSEHTLNGKHFPLEIHFVSKANDGTYAVIAMFFTEGKKDSFFTKFLDKLPLKEGDTYKNNTVFDLSEISGNTSHFYHYNGSFTTPPCTEIVEWIILKEAKTASKKQLDKLHNLLHDNFRFVQKLNNRQVDLQ